MKTLIINNTTTIKIHSIIINVKKLADCPKGYYRNLYKLEFELPKRTFRELMMVDIVSFQVKGYFNSSEDHCKDSRIQNIAPIGLCEDFVDCYLCLESQILRKEGIK